MLAYRVCVCVQVLGYICCPLFCPLYFACGCLQPDPALNDANPTKGCTALDRACNCDNADVVQFLLAQANIKPKQESMKVCAADTVPLLWSPLTPTRSDDVGRPVLAATIVG